MREDAKAKVEELNEQVENEKEKGADTLLVEWFLKHRKANKAKHDNKKHYYEANRGEADEGRETGRQD